MMLNVPVNRYGHVGINLLESMGPGRDRIYNPWICSQTHICSQARNPLYSAAWWRKTYWHQLLNSLPLFYLQIYFLFYEKQFIHIVYIFNSFLASCNFCHLLTFANSLYPEQNRQNVGPDLDPNCLTLMKEFFEKS